MAESAIVSGEGTATPAVTTSTANLIQLEVYGALLALFAIALFLALVTYDHGDVAVGVGSGLSTHNLLGPVGAHMANLFLWVLGLAAFLFDAALGLVGFRAVFRRPVRLGVGTVGWSAAVVLTAAVLLQIAARGFKPLGHSPAGLVGTYAGEVMAALFSDRGAVLLSAATLIIAVAYLTGQSIGGLIRVAWRGLRAATLASWRWLCAASSATWARASDFVARAFRRQAPVASEEPTVILAEDLVHDTKVERPAIAEPAWAVDAPAVIARSEVAAVTDRGIAPVIEVEIPVASSRVAEEGVESPRRARAR